MASRRGNSSSTPAKGLNNSWITVPRPFEGTASRFRDSARIRLTSSSMERPFPAARKRSLVFTSFSMFLIVMLAIALPSATQVPILQAISMQSNFLVPKKIAVRPRLSAIPALRGSLASRGSRIDRVPIRGHRRPLARDGDFGLRAKRFPAAERAVRSAALC